MNLPFEEFQLDLYHSKMEWMAIKSDYEEKPWSNFDEQRLNSIYTLCNEEYDLEAHLLAAGTYFQDKFTFPEILDVLYETAKPSKDYPNKVVFTTLFYNRLKLRSSK